MPRTAGSRGKLPCYFGGSLTSESPPERRFLGVDFGEVRIGLSLSDASGTLASPLPTLQRRRGKRPPLAAIEAIAREHAVVGLVMGLPLELSGEEGVWAREVRSVGETLATRLGLPICFVDERMTSVRAERMVRSSGLRLHQREDRARVDAGSAVLILQSWLDQNE